MSEKKGNPKKEQRKANTSNASLTTDGRASNQRKQDRKSNISSRKNGIKKEESEANEKNKAHNANQGNANK